jgi:hypothetical protein
VKEESAANTTQKVPVRRDVTQPNWYEVDGYKSRGDGKSPAYIWQSGVFAAEFARQFLSDCNVEGQPAVKEHFEVLLQHLQVVLGWCGGEIAPDESRTPAPPKPAEAQLDAIDKKAMHNLSEILDLLRSGPAVEDLMKDAGEVAKFPKVLNHMMQRVEGLDQKGFHGRCSGEEITHNPMSGIGPIGICEDSNMKTRAASSMMVFRSGWNARSDYSANKIGFCMHVLERTSDDHYSIVTCNTTMDAEHLDREDKFVGGVAYHSATSDEYPRIKARTAMCINDIPRHRIVDPAVWYTLLQNMTDVKPGNCAEVVYGVVLPHLAGNLSLKHALEKSVPTSANATPQKHASGDKALNKPSHGSYEYLYPARSTYSTMITCVSYLMQRLGTGMSHVQQKQVLFTLRLAYLQTMERDFEHSELHGLQLHDSDKKMMRLACEQLAIDAVQQHKNNCMDKIHLQRVGDRLETLMQRIGHLVVADEVGMRHRPLWLSRDGWLAGSPTAVLGAAICPLIKYAENDASSSQSMCSEFVKGKDGNCTGCGKSHASTSEAEHPRAPVVQFRPMHNFEKIEEDESSEQAHCASGHWAGDQATFETFGGPKTQAEDEMFVDMRLPQVKGVGDLVDAIEKCAKGVQRLRAKTAVADSTLCNHQILAFVEHAFTDVIPLPTGGVGQDQSATGFTAANDPIYTENIGIQQRDCLRHLYTILLEYVCCSKALFLKDDSAIKLARVVTASSIMAVFDGIVRVEPQATHNTQRHKLSRLPSVVKEGGFRPSTKSWDNETELVHILGWRDPDQMPTYMYNPNMIRRRREVVNYFYNKQYQELQPLLDLKDEGHTHSIYF